MEEIEGFTDDRQKAWCIHCGAWISSAPTNRDHVPSKSLLDRPLPSHVPQVEVCRPCNSGFSKDEEYFTAFVSCVLTGSTTPQAQMSAKVQRAFVRNPSLAARIEAAKKTFTTQDGEERVIWEPEIERIHRVVLKNARGHAYFEFGEPMLDEPAHIWALPLASLDVEQRSQFENVSSSGWPEVGSRMMTRLLSGADIADGWVEVQEGVYRYAVLQEGTMLVRSVVRDYLATEVFWD